MKFILLMNIKMPTICVGILIFISRIIENYFEGLKLSPDYISIQISCYYAELSMKFYNSDELSMPYSFITLGPGVCGLHRSTLHIEKHH